MDDVENESGLRTGETTADRRASVTQPLDGDDSSAEHASRDQLRAMAHPLRLELMERMGRRGTARAADLAADLGIPANSVSYHLRILARGGVIEEAPEAARDRRDRVWRLAQLSYYFGREEGTVSDDGTAAATEYSAASDAASLAVFDWMRTAWSAELARPKGRSPLSEEGSGNLFATTVRLTAAEMQEMNGAVSEILQNARVHHRDESGADLPDPIDGDETHTYQVLWAAVGQQPSAPHSGTE